MASVRYRPQSLISRIAYPLPVPRHSQPCRIRLTEPGAGTPEAVSQDGVQMRPLEPAAAIIGQGMHRSVGDHAVGHDRAIEKFERQVFPRRSRRFGRQSSDDVMPDRCTGAIGSFPLCQLFDDIRRIPEQVRAALAADVAGIGYSAPEGAATWIGHAVAGMKHGRDRQTKVSGWFIPQRGMAAVECNSLLKVIVFSCF